DVSAKLNPSFSFILNTFFRKSIEYVIMTLLYPIYWNLAILGQRLPMRLFAYGLMYQAQVTRL
ncbi:MAG: hypothetical protein LBH67_01675, partial [Rickettsia sp.]|nr:hypothetical protein [Rickettsia sp.]